MQRLPQYPSVMHPIVQSCPSLSHISVPLGTSKSSMLDSISSMFKNWFYIYRLKTAFANTHSHAILVYGIKDSPFKETISSAEQLLRTGSEAFLMENSTATCGKPGGSSTLLLHFKNAAGVSHWDSDHLKGRLSYKIHHFTSVLLTVNLSSISTFLGQNCSQLRKESFEKLTENSFGTLGHGSLLIRVTYHSVWARRSAGH